MQATSNLKQVMTQENRQGRETTVATSRYWKWDQHSNAEIGSGTNTLLRRLEVGPTLYRRDWKWDQHSTAEIGSGTNTLLQRLEVGPTLYGSGTNTLRKWDQHSTAEIGSGTNTLRKWDQHSNAEFKP